MRIMEGMRDQVKGLSFLLRIHSPLKYFRNPHVLPKLFLKAYKIEYFFRRKER
jgi:hypothetical protein